jgi:hypothetical protein
MRRARSLNHPCVALDPGKIPSYSDSIQVLDGFRRNEGREEINYQELTGSVVLDCLLEELYNNAAF